MRTHLTDGDLRAALDGELDELRLQHLDGCTHCQARRQQLEQEGQKTAQLLGFLTSTEGSVPSAQRAWNRLNQQIVTKKETDTGRTIGEI